MRHSAGQSEYSSELSRRFFRTTQEPISEIISDMGKPQHYDVRATALRLAALREAFQDTPSWPADEPRTIRAFAGWLGVGEDRYDAWEKAKAKLPVEWAMELARRFRFGLDWIYTGHPQDAPATLDKAIKKRLAG